MPTSVAAAAAKIKDVTIKTGPKGGLGNVAVQTTPYDEIRGATVRDVYTSDNALRQFLKDDTVGHNQRVFRNRSVPANAESVQQALTGDNGHITLFKHDYVDGKPVDSVVNGASKDDLDKLMADHTSLRQVDATIQYSVHGAGGERKLFEHKVSLLHENWGGGRVVAAVDHMPGEAASMWERLAQAIKDNGGKVLKHIIRA